MILITAMLFVGLFTFCYGQDVKVNINNKDYSSNGDCDFKINGICSSEDIGGVEIRGLIKTIRFAAADGYGLHTFAVLTNYHDFPVTVLVQFTHNSIQSIVLKKNETKEIDLGVYDSTPEYHAPVETSMPIQGMIVRKL